MYRYRNMSPAEREAVLAERRARGFPLHAPPHFRGIVGEYLITAACYEHRRIFDTPDTLSYLTDEMLRALDGAGLEFSAWVFLPNHYHILLTAPDLRVVGEVLRIAHSRIATTMNYQQGQPGRKVWYRYSDRFIRSERHHWASFNYIHYNPVKHGYVSRITDWPWVSAHEYMSEQGREWMTRTWRAYPIKDYGKGWDD